MSVRKTTSKTSARCFAELLGIGFALCMSTNIAFADDRIDLEQLTAQWWQWAFSIPTPQNPINDPNGGSCVIGQRGSLVLGGLFRRNNDSNLLCTSRVDAVFSRYQPGRLQQSQLRAGSGKCILPKTSAKPSPVPLIR